MLHSGEHDLWEAQMIAAPRLVAARDAARAARDAARQISTDLERVGARFRDPTSAGLSAAEVMERWRQAFRAMSAASPSAEDVARRFTGR